MPIPAPPFSTEAERNVGIQVNNPQYAKSTTVAIDEPISVKRNKGGRNISLRFPETPPMAPPARDLHMAGSGTLRRIQNVRRAGKMPMRNNALQPNRGRMAAANSAARR